MSFIFFSFTYAFCLLILINFLVERYTQCELMSVHYKHPVLLIEFEEDKAFTLEVCIYQNIHLEITNTHFQTVADMKLYTKPSTKFPPKKSSSSPADPSTYSSSTIQSKIVLLTLTFPRLRIIWSSSPYASADIFNDLKANNAEPDPTKAIAVGADDDPEVGAGINAAAEELLRCLPGITTKNVKYVMSKVNNVRELCGLSLSQVQEVLGVEPGRACFDFMHKGEK